jgi:dienelactone hydrolase
MEETIMRENVEFDADGVTLRGWLYIPDGASSPAPAVVMAPGFSALKEMHADRFAEAFADAGLVALVYDHRNFGASDGEPRQEVDPWAQVRDYRTAITYATTRLEVDPERIGVWGSSYAGGHVLVVAAIDRRVKCVVSQAPFVSGHETFRAFVRADFIADVHAQFDADREARFRGDAPAMVPVVDQNPLVPSAVPTADAYEWFTETRESRAPLWRNETTLRSVEMTSEYEPGTYLPWISPTPLLMCVAENDVTAPTDIAIRNYATANEPKKLLFMPGGHFDAYADGFGLATAAAVQWFTQHLIERSRVPALTDSTQTRDRRRRRTRDARPIRTMLRPALLSPTL